MIDFSDISCSRDYHEIGGNVSQRVAQKHYHEAPNFCHLASLATKFLRFGTADTGRFASLRPSRLK
jgi:hypothetical protein